MTFVLQSLPPKTWCWLPFAIFMCCDVSWASEPKKKNLVVILADDLGFDVGCFGAPLAQSPNIDRMANQGVKLTQWYAASSVCSPSRAALLTGRYPPRIGFWTNYQGPADRRVLHPNAIGTLSTSEITLAEALRAQGYRTAMVGKWHLGYYKRNLSNLPLGRGFDEFLGTPATHCESGGAWPPEPVFQNQDRIGRLDYDILRPDLMTKYTEFAIRFLTNMSREDSPFFLYAAYDNTHEGVYALPNYSGSTLAGPFGDAVASLDWAVGQILHAVESSGLKQDTLVILTSDNGGWLYASGPTEQRSTTGFFGGEWAKDPLRNTGVKYTDTGKGSSFEGGYRVPAVAWGLDLPQGVTQHGMVSSLDIFATALEMAHAPEQPRPRLDGTSILGLLRQNTSRGASPRQGFFFYATRANGRSSLLQAVRYGKYKVHFYTRSGWGRDPEMHHDPPLVFDVEVDPGERTQLRPSVWISIKAEVNQFIADHEKDFVYRDPLFDVVDPTGMDCDGLSGEYAACCNGHGLCQTKHPDESAPWKDERVLGAADPRPSYLVRSKRLRSLVKD